MHNPVLTTAAATERDDLRRAPVSSLDAAPRFAPLCILPVKLAITTVSDELGRPLVGVFAPDSELL
jgi:hypothetical protein